MLKVGNTDKMFSAGQFADFLPLKLMINWVEKCTILGFSWTGMYKIGFFVNFSLPKMDWPNTLLEEN